MPNIQPEDGQEGPAIKAQPLGYARKRLASSPVGRRLLRGLGATALGPVVTAAIQLGTVPLLLHSWGAAKYGDWLILSAIPSYLTLSDLGFGDASGSDMTMRVAAGDRKGAIETFQSSLVLLSVVSLCIGLIVSIAVWHVPWHHWVKLTTLSDARASLVVFVLAIYVLISQQFGVLESGFRCDGNFATGVLGGNLVRFVEVGLGSVVGVLTGSLFWAATTYLITRIVGIVIYALVLHSRSPWIAIGYTSATYSRIKKLAAPALGFVALPLANAISIQGFTLVTASVLGSVAVVQFSTLRTLARITCQISNTLSCTIWPELSRAFGEGNIPLARTLHRRAYQAGLGLAFISGLSLWLFGPIFYRAWIRNAVTFDPTCFHILLFVSLVNSLWFISSVVPMSTNTHHRITMAYVALSSISLGFAWVLVGQLGIRGAAIALLLIDIPMTYLVLRTSLLQMQESLGDFIQGILIPFPSHRSIGPRGLALEHSVSTDNDASP